MNIRLIKAITAIDIFKQCIEQIDDETLETLVKLGYGYTHIIGAGISCSGKIPDTDLMKIAKCIIGNVNYRNRVPADDNNSLMDTIDNITDRYIHK